MMETPSRAKQTTTLNNDLNDPTMGVELNAGSQSSIASVDSQDGIPISQAPSASQESEPGTWRKRRFRPRPLPDLSGSTTSLAASDSGLSSSSSSLSGTNTSTFASGVPTTGTSLFDSVSRSSLLSSRQNSDDYLASFMKRGRYESDLITDESDGFLSADALSSDSLSSPNSTPARILIGGRSEKEKLEYLTNDCLIGDYHIIGAGKEAKAVHRQTNIVLAPHEVLSVTKVIYRLDNAAEIYKGYDLEQLKELVFPSSAELVEEVSGRVLLITPIDGGSLHSFAESKAEKMAEADIEPLFKQIVRILAFCHEIGIIVRDLKPKKFVFDKETNKLRLGTVVDCVVLDDPNNDLVKEKFGSPAYVPPEVLTKKSRVHSAKAAAMWGLGVTTYMVLLGRYPFYDNNPRGLFEKIRKAKVVFPPTYHLSRGARVIIYGLLRREPLERPSASQLLAMPIWKEPCTAPCRIPRLSSLFPAQQDFGPIRLRLDQMFRRTMERSQNMEEDSNAQPRLHQPLARLTQTLRLPTQQSTNSTNSTTSQNANQAQRPAWMTQPSAFSPFVPLQQRPSVGPSPIATSIGQQSRARSSVQLPTVSSEDRVTRPIETGTSLPLYRSRTMESRTEQPVSGEIRPMQTSRLHAIQTLVNALSMFYSANTSPEVSYNSFERLQRDAEISSQSEPSNPSDGYDTMTFERPDYSALLGPEDPEIALHRARLRQSQQEQQQQQQYESALLDQW
ncbi:hypothetical protein WR25_08614 [Diploscapter pachys]|uniref:Protein kinase domain-containing protein n=1 Tax=Diploscapter pachys TaxID=2018661 RepID=A0A2A2L0K9_9BILA|nr:hypothetical protein WR25_08614 [Diploscapter pachys]